MDNQDGEERLRRGVENGDAVAMFELAQRLELRARALSDESRALFERAAVAGSLDAARARVRLEASNGEYAQAGLLLDEVRRGFPDVPMARLITVAPDVLGRHLAFDGDGEWDGRGAGTFTIVARDPAATAAAVAPVLQQLMLVDEHGARHGSHDEVDRVRHEAYTPTFVFDPVICAAAVQITVDTKGWMSAAMGRTMVGILADALADAGVPAHITGHRPDLDAHWQPWTAPPAPGH